MTNKGAGGTNKSLAGLSSSQHNNYIGESGSSLKKKSLISGHAGLRGLIREDHMRQPPNYNEKYTMNSAKGDLMISPQKKATSSLAVIPQQK
jgi:hypothetical protein